MHVSSSVFLCEVIYYSRGSLTLATHMCIYVVCTTHFLRCSSLFTPFFSSFSSSPLYINRHQERKGFSRICVSNMHRHLFCILSLCFVLNKISLAMKDFSNVFERGDHDEDERDGKMMRMKMKMNAVVQRVEQDDDDDETGEKVRYNVCVWSCVSFPGLSSHSFCCLVIFPWILYTFLSFLFLVLMQD